jgi:hypothetical protein
VEDSIDDIAVEAAKAINSHQSRMGEEAENLQIAGGAQYKIYLGSAEGPSMSLRLKYHERYQAHLLPVSG